MSGGMNAINALTPADRTAAFSLLDIASYDQWSWNDAELIKALKNGVTVPSWGTRAVIDDENSLVSSENTALRNWKIPESATFSQRKAMEYIRAFFSKRQRLYTGGCRSFYTPEQWNAKESADLNVRTAVAVICGDGGEVSYAINSMKGDVAFYRAFNAHLEAAGLYTESLTCWATAIYERP
jgi:hypothetical protein